MTARYKVEWFPAARRQFKRLDRPVAARLLRAITELTNEPRPPGVKRLVGADDVWRVRVGDYRVVYEIRDDILIISVIGVAHRSAVYREL